MGAFALLLFASWPACAASDKLWEETGLVQTSCLEHHNSRRDSVTAVLARAREKSRATTPQTRSVTFFTQGFEYRLGQVRTAYRWSALKEVLAQRIAGAMTRFSVTLITESGTASGGPLGVIDGPCWRAMERIADSQAPGSVHYTSADPKPET